MHIPITTCRTRKAQAFTLVEIMIVTSIIGVLATIAVPSFLKSRRRSQTVVCQHNQRVIFEAINMYCMQARMGTSPAEWPNLCAARDRLSPGGTELYLKDWTVFDCPISDNQIQHDYAYVFVNGEMTDVRCNNSSASVRNLHNQ